jgi:hypothetical protein
MTSFKRDCFVGEHHHGPERKGEHHHGPERETMVAGGHGVPPPGKVIGRGLGRRERSWETNKIWFCL